MCTIDVNQYDEETGKTLLLSFFLSSLKAELQLLRLRLRLKNSNRKRWTAFRALHFHFSAFSQVSEAHIFKKFFRR